MHSQTKPHPQLANYIDAFWMVEGTAKEVQKQSILPDGCVDLIFNFGNDCKIANGNITLQQNKTYLVGTMTTFQNSFLASSHKLMGVRFKPATFSSFYNYASLSEVKDTTIEFEQPLSPQIHKIAQHSVSYLNAYFLGRLKDARHNLFSVVKEMEAANGQISVQALAKKHFLTERGLERGFQQHIGISPKEFANIIRFRSALSKIKNKPPGQSLLHIAFDCGYYDHSHLAKDIKRYTGLSPSQL